MHDLKVANKEFISKAAFLVSDMHYDADCPPTEKQVDMWRNYTIDIVGYLQRAHAEIKYMGDKWDDYQQTIKSLNGA